jgi:alpha-mannosidase
VTIRVHVVPHTHWDREWYHGAARFRLRLARLMDDLVELLRGRPDYPSFLLDGQAIVLDDYLAVRPEAGDAVRRLLAEGRLEAGPWYVLPDELLVSAEALVRNLIEGGTAVRRLGGTAMRVGYTPDAFGHSGALPLVLRGFGIDVALLWRGFGGEPGQEGDLHRWRSADGCEVLMIHLPAPGYEYGSGISAGGSALPERWDGLRAMLEPRARSPHWLVMAGADHHAAQPDLPEVVEEFRALAPDCDVRMGSLGGYAERVRGWSTKRDQTLPVVEGELRGGHRHAWALQGTHASRLYLKQANAACQRLLQRYAEPLGALAAGRGGRDRRAELRAAWRTLLENHPHDSLCGTSADPVHREMMTRFARCRDEAEEIRHAALFEVAGHDAAAARDAGRKAWKPAVLLFNPSPFKRSGVVEAEVAVFRADVPVGQGSRAGRAARPQAAEIVLKDARGVRVAVQELERRVGHELIESHRHYPDCDEVEWHRVVVYARDLPPLGVAAWSVGEAGALARRRGKPPPSSDPVIVEAAEMHNAQLWLRVEAGGSFVVLDRASGESYHGLGVLEDNGDAGDSYTYSAPGRDRVVDAPDEVAASVVHGGPLRGTLEILRRYRETGLETRTRVTLDAGATHLAVEVFGRNPRADHRLRMRFPLGRSPQRVVADGHFGPVERSVGAPAARSGDRLETPAPTAPMQRYVSVVAGARGVTVLADGLPEYEARHDGTVLVTLLRAFGELSRADLPERPGHAGWPTPTPEAQCLGPFTARLGLCFHDEAALAQLDGIERAAEDFHAPVMARMLRSALRYPEEVTGPELVGGGLVFSAMKPAEDGKGIVLRCYNPAASAVRGAWCVGSGVWQAGLCRLDETPLEPLEANDRGTIQFTTDARAVVTISVR